MKNLIIYTRIIAATFILFCSLVASAQVSKVKYYLRYSESSCLWEMCIIIEEGEATAPIHRAQFNSQIAIVVPTGSIFTIEKSLMPIQGNQNYTGTKPLTWFVNNFVASPQAQPQNDFIGIAPILNPTSFFNNLKAKDTIVLFRASISGLAKCGDGVRVYENGVDPSSSATGMNGGDFSNGYTIGSLDQKYNGNVKTKGPSLPIVKDLVSSCVNGLSINFNTSTLACHGGGSNTFLWKGPNGFTTTSQNVSIPNASSTSSGEYTLIIADNIGCRDTLSIVASPAPNAGEDSYVNCYSNGVGVLHSTGAGVWKFLSAESAGNASINDAGGLSTEVNGFTAAGFYTFERDNGQCSDKVKIYVDNKCNCSTGNFISTSGSKEFCSKAEGIKLDGGKLSGDDYLWIYKLNNGSYRLAPGANIFNGYTTLSLGVGDHTYRRIYTNQGGTCSDTSQAIILTVKEGISVKGDTILQCYKNATVNIKATGAGYWVVNSGNQGDLNLSNFLDRNAVVSQFSQPGIYKLTWTNDFCSDTVVIDAKPFCGCIEANVEDNTNLCKGDKVILKGSCPDGRWALQGLTNNMARIDSIINGNAYLSLNWDSIPASFKAIFSVDLGTITLADTMNLFKRVNPKLEVGQNFDYCRGSEDVIISASGATNGYQWSNGATSRYILVSPEITTKYSVIARNDYGCRGYDTVTIFVHEKPKGQLPTSLRLKVGEKLVINAGFWTEAIDFSWTGPNDFVSNKKNLEIENVQLSQAGVYTLTVLSAYDCYTYSTIRVDIATALLDTPTNGVVGQNQSNSHTRTPTSEGALEISKMSIAPNPSASFTTISFLPVDVERSLHIFNQLGKLVHADIVDALSSSVLIDGRNLLPGVYTVILNNGHNRSSVRWVIVE